MPLSNVDVWNVSLKQSPACLFAIIMKKNLEIPLTLLLCGYVVGRVE